MLNDLKEIISKYKNQPETLVLREVYDAAVDYFTEELCFHNRSLQVCMFESYGTIVDYEKVKDITSKFTESELSVLVKCFESIGFTPNASLVATYLKLGVRHAQD